MPPRRRYAAPKEAWHAKCTGAVSTGARVRRYAGTSTKHTRLWMRILRTQSEQHFSTNDSKSRPPERRHAADWQKGHRETIFFRELASIDAILERAPPANSCNHRFAGTCKRDTCTGHTYMHASTPLRARARGMLHDLRMRAQSMRSLNESIRKLARVSVMETRFPSGIVQSMQARVQNACAQRKCKRKGAVPQQRPIEGCHLTRWSVTCPPGPARPIPTIPPSPTVFRKQKLFC